MLKITEIKVSHRREPINIDRGPTLSWQLESDNRAVVQRAYAISVRDDKKVVYKSGAVASDECIGIALDVSLKPHACYIIELVVWDNTGEEANATTRFEAGIVDPDLFSAEWISSPADCAVPVFSKKFECQNAVKAKLYASACGIFDVKINGNFVSDDRYAPGWTSYDKHIEYASYDITELIAESNEIELTVAPGWYAGYLNGEGRRGFYGNKLAAFCEIHIWNESGKEFVIASDKSWTVYTGEIVSADFYMGETVDKTNVKKELGYAVKFDGVVGKFVAAESAFAHIDRHLKPIERIITPKGEVVLDFGQNIAGVIRLEINGEYRRKVTVRHAEVLDRHGNFYTDNLRTAKSTDTFILSGSNDVFLPRFTYHGFRYIAVDGLGDDFDINIFTACAVHNNMQETCEFDCSDERVNNLFSNIKWSMRDNFIDIPTDCPQRDERLGWTGDAAIFSATASQLEDVYMFYRKWLKDLVVEQTLENGLPDTIPNILVPRGMPGGGSAVWGDAATIVPWELYRHFGDVGILREQYDSMKMWVEHMRRAETPLHLRQSGHQRGDWLALDREEGKGNSGATDPYLIATAFYALGAYIVAQSAKALGYADDEKEYSSLLSNIVNGFKREYITPTGRVVSETQTALALILSFNLAPEHSARISDNLVSNVSKHKNKPTTGFIGTPYLMTALSVGGKHDTAGKILLNDEFPGWLNEVKLGATTIWERWDSVLPDGSFDESGMNSFNHYSFGAVGNWLIEYLVGIKINEAGYKRVTIRPGFIQGITHAKAERLTPYGKLSVFWQCLNGKITVRVRIPVNTSATLFLPESGQVELGSGEYSYEYSTQTDLSPQAYSMDTPIRELCKHPRFTQIMEEQMKGSTQMLHMEFLQSKSLAELCAMANDENYFKAYSKVIDLLNKEKPL